MVPQKWLHIHADDFLKSRESQNSFIVEFNQFISQLPIDLQSVSTRPLIG
jgi:hypothetical protein